MKTRDDKTLKGFEARLLPILLEAVRERQSSRPQEAPTAWPARRQLLRRRRPAEREMPQKYRRVQPAWKRGKRPRKRVLILVAAAVVAVTTAATARVLIQDDPEPPADLQDAVGSLFSEGRCVTATEAADGIRARLDSLGYEEWATASRQGVESDGCVAPGFLTPEKLIVLVPVDRPEVAQAIQGVAGELMRRCLGEEQATELLSSVLAALGVTNPNIRTDGPLAYPSGQEEAVRAHIASGCFVYSGSGRDPAGQPIYYITGPGA